MVSEYENFISGDDLLNQIPLALNNPLIMVHSQTIENAVSSIVFLKGIQLLGVITIQLDTPNIFIESIELKPKDI